MGADVRASDSLTAVRAIQMSEFGGPEVLQPVELPQPQPGRDEALIRVTRAGINFADTHTRTNSYVQRATLPLIPGGEVAGVRVDTGERVVALVGEGGYAEYATAPSELIFPIPDGLDEGTALALIVQGTTAWHLYRTAGGAVFDASYRALAPFGRIVAYGIASNEPNAPSTGSLLRHSRAVVGFYLFHCLQRPGMFDDALQDLFARAAGGQLRVVVGQ